MTDHMKTTFYDERGHCTGMRIHGNPDDVWVHADLQWADAKIEVSMEEQASVPHLTPTKRLAWLRENWSFAVFTVAMTLLVACAVGGLVAAFLDDLRYERACEAVGGHIVDRGNWICVSPDGRLIEP